MDNRAEIESWTSSQRICPWVGVSSVPDLRSGELHLWWVPLQGNDEELEALRATLSTREKDRADRYRFARHRNGYTFGRGVLKMLLSAYTGMGPEQIDFQLGPYGKPSLLPSIDVKALCFNYSDAGGYALYGFTRDAEIGVDLEDLEREVSFERIVERKFSIKEAKSILSLPPHQRKSAFLTCWTRKEGYGKAQGWGINYPLDSVELCVDCQSNRVDVTASDSEIDRWVVYQLYPSGHFVGTLVYPAAVENSGPFSIKYLTTSPGQMLQR